MSEEQTIHQQIANFLGNLLQNHTIAVNQMADMNTSMNWLQSIAKGEMVVSEVAPAEDPAAPPAPEGEEDKAA